MLWILLILSFPVYAENNQDGDLNVSQLQGKLAELGANLEQIMTAQKELLDLRDRISLVEKSNSETLLTVNAKIETIAGVDERIKKIDREINDI